MKKNYAHGADYYSLNENHYIFASIVKLNNNHTINLATWQKYRYKLLDFSKKAYVTIIGG